MKYTVTFEVNDGNCELYKMVDTRDCESACKSCPLRLGKFCMDLDMHKATIVDVQLNNEHKHD